jgi:ABC transporter ATM
VPFFFKLAVDALTLDPTGATPVTMLGVLALAPPAALAGYGIARAGASFCSEMRNLVFAKVRRGRLFTAFRGRPVRLAVG